MNEDHPPRRPFFKAITFEAAVGITVTAILGAATVIVSSLSDGQVIRWLGATTPHTIGTDLEGLSNNPREFSIVTDLIRQHSNKIDEEVLLKRIEDALRKQIDDLVRKQVADTIGNLPADSAFTRQILRSVSVQSTSTPILSVIDVWLSEVADKVDLREDRDLGILKLLRALCDGKMECRIFPTEDDLFFMLLDGAEQFSDYEESSAARSNASISDILAGITTIYMHIHYRCGSEKDIRKHQFPLNTYIIINCE